MSNHSEISFIEGLIAHEEAMSETINTDHPNFDGSDEQEMFAQHQENLVMLGKVLTAISYTEIRLGDGRHRVTHIYDKDGSWAGIAISLGESHLLVGEECEPNCDTVRGLNPLVTITTDNPKSLEVVIGACVRAKKSLEVVK